MKKIYVLDTNVLLADSSSIYAFADRDVVIPMTVIEELDKKKKEVGELGYHARNVFRILSDLRKKGNLWDGVKTECGGKISVRYVSPVKDIVPYAEKLEPCSSDFSKNDNLIICMAAIVKYENPDAEVILVTNDAGMQITADMVNLKTEYYRKNRLKDEDLVYTGRTRIMLNTSEHVWKSSIFNSGIPFDEFSNLTEEELHLEENQFLELLSPNGEITLARYFEGNVYPLYQADKKPFDITYRNSGQAFAIESLMTCADNAPFVFIKSPAGTGKTFLALACALEQVLELNIYRNIIYTRCNVRFDSEDLGALPGTEEEKMSPLVRPAMDNLEHLAEIHFGRTDRKLNPFSRWAGNDSAMRISEFGQYLIDKDVLRIESMSYMRGRSLDNTFLIIDEAQNCSISQIRGILTRPGVNTKIVLLGDPDQIDSRYLDKYNNGLCFAAERFRGSKLAMQVTLSEEECVRSAATKEAAERLK